ncbi:MAG: hypothetical protein V4673_17235 [Pseudomonadota bacterium]
MDIKVVMIRLDSAGKRGRLSAARTLPELRRAVRGFDHAALRARAPALLRARDRAGIERWLAQALG